jgi:hypothetical protein
MVIPSAVEGSRGVTLNVSWRDSSTTARDDRSSVRGFDKIQIAANLIARFGGHRPLLQGKI